MRKIIVQLILRMQTNTLESNLYNFIWASPLAEIPSTPFLRNINIFSQRVYIYKAVTLALLRALGALPKGNALSSITWLPFVAAGTAMRLSFHVLFSSLLFLKWSKEIEKSSFQNLGSPSESGKEKLFKLSLFFTLQLIIEYSASWWLRFRTIHSFCLKIKLIADKNYTHEKIYRWRIRWQ